MALTKQQKIELLINHPCVTWKGSDLDAENLIIDLTISNCPSSKQIKKPKYVKKEIDANILDKCWTAPHIKALMSKVETSVKYTKLAETRSELKKIMNENIKMAMGEVIKEFAEAKKNEKPKEPHNVFKNAKVQEVDTTVSESKEPRRVKLFEPNKKDDKTPKENLKDLMVLAKGMGIKKISQLNKSQLKEAIENFKNNKDTGDDEETRLNLLKIVETGSNKMKLSELKKRAKELGIKNYSKMNKATLESKILEEERKSDSKEENNEGYPEVKQNDDGLNHLDEIGTSPTEILGDIQEETEDRFNEFLQEKDENSDDENYTGAEQKEEHYDDILEEEPYE